MKPKTYEVTLTTKCKVEALTKQEAIEQALIGSDTNFLEVQYSQHDKATVKVMKR